MLIGLSQGGEDGGRASVLLPPVLELPASPWGWLVTAGLGLLGLMWFAGSETRRRPTAKPVEFRKRRSRSLSTRAPRKPAGVIADVAEVLKTQGLRAADAKRVAARAAGGGGDFDAVVRRAIRMATE